MTTDTFYVSQKRYKPTDPRLGRHVRHDSRSRRYAIKAAPDVLALQSVRHERHIPILDQGQIGSCTGNAAVGCLGTGMFWNSAPALNFLSAVDADADEQYALGVYSEATTLDVITGTYPPDDTGSDGLSVSNVALRRGLISGYTHALTLEAALTALARQPVITGTVWREDMFNPDSDGRIHITGAEAGGHEYVLSELDVENCRVWMDNSWGMSWGVEGRAYFTWDDYGALLADQGDCTAFVPVTQPSPDPTPVPESDPRTEFLQAAHVWNMDERHGENGRFQKELNKFLTWYTAS